jgi:hypothetical protein
MNELLSNSNSDTIEDVKDIQHANQVKSKSKHHSRTNTQEDYMVNDEEIERKDSGKSPDTKEEAKKAAKQKLNKKKVMKAKNHSRENTQEDSLVDTLQINSALIEKPKNAIDKIDEKNTGYKSGKANTPQTQDRSWNSESEAIVTSNSDIIQAPKAIYDTISYINQSHTDGNLNIKL